MPGISSLFHLFVAPHAHLPPLYFSIFSRLDSERELPTLAPFVAFFPDGPPMTSRRKLEPRSNGPSLFLFYSSLFTPQVPGSFYFGMNFS